MSGGLQTISVIDSHTEGEPTRVVVEGGPALFGDTLAAQSANLDQGQLNLLRGIVTEPRGSDAVVGALLCEPQADADFGVIFFNNVGCLGMCGHGTIGLVRTLEYMGKLRPGAVSIDTPAGVVRAVLHEDGQVSVANVKSYRFRKGVTVEVEGLGTVRGDIAYGGNWFFLVHEHGQVLDMDNLDELTRYATHIRKALDAQGVTGEGGAQIDHVELFGPPVDPSANSRNFVLCPGLAYDRSPCGTGLSAKLACLAGDGVLAPGETWKQESIVGSSFEGSYDLAANGILPTITGRAYITAESKLVFDPADPFKHGIASQSGVCA
jgi:4-hydroxyproline epimerase